MATNIQEQLLEALRHNGDFPEDLSEIWNDLLEILQNEHEEDLLNHYLIREKGTKKDFDDSSIIGIIQGLADLNDDAWDDILDTNATKNFWNESVSDAIKHYIKNFKASANTAIPGTNDQITYGGIWKADAGFKFDGEEWVKPWKNIDEANYIEVRNKDQIVEGVLNNEKELQFTHIQNPSEDVKDWIRLLMPMYTRHVEIEDLDRNFWVIGQVISGISAYLFDNNSPITAAIKNLLREITELWENILYLWAALAMLNRKEYTDIHTEVVYIPNDEHHPYLKYDNFADDTLSWQDICTRFEYLKQDYPESNLVIVPVRRMNNYYHNYYSIERYPGIMIYNRNKPNTAEGYNGFKIISFANESGKAIVQYTPSSSEIIPASETANALYGLSNYLTCAKVTNDSVSYFAPASDITSISELEPSKYIAAIRSRINIVPSYDDDTIKLGSVYVTLHDAIGTSVAAAQGNSGYHDSDIGTFLINNGQPITEPDSSRVNIGASFIAGSTPTPTKDDDTPAVKAGKLLSGYYLGEIPSSSKKTKQVEYKLKERTIEMPPIVTNSKFWTGGEDENTTPPPYKTYYYDIKQVESKIRNNSNTILNEYYNKVGIGTTNTIQLLVGYRRFDLFKKGAHDYATYTYLDTDDYSDTDIGIDIQKAIGYGGLGGYFAIDEDNHLIERHSLEDNYYKRKPNGTDLYTTYKLDYENHYGNEGEGKYRLPFAIYHKISNVNTGDKDDYTFDGSNIFSKNLYSYSNLTNAIADTKSKTDPKNHGVKFTGAHGGRLETGAILSIPGITQKLVYNKYKGYKILPNVSKNSTTDGAYVIWLPGETGKGTRHTWNNQTTLIYRKQGDENWKTDNWCIIYIKSYGIYAPTGKLNNETNVPKVKNAPTIQDEQCKVNEQVYSGALQPMVFKTYVHVFKPNNVYTGHCSSNWEPIEGYNNNRPQAGSDDSFEWKDTAITEEWGVSPSTFIQDYDDMLKLALNQSANGYTLISTESEYTKYEKINGKWESSSDNTQNYNFYRYPFKGQA